MESGLRDVRVPKIDDSFTGRCVESPKGSPGGPFLYVVQVEVARRSQRIKSRFTPGLQLSCVTQSDLTRGVRHFDSSWSRESIQATSKNRKIDADRDASFTGYWKIEARLTSVARLRKRSRYPWLTSKLLCVPCHGSSRLVGLLMG